MAKKPTAAERLGKCQALAQQTRRFGSMYDSLSLEFRNRPRDFGELTAELAKRTPPELPTPERDSLLDTPFALPS